MASIAPSRLFPLPVKQEPETETDQDQSLVVASRAIYDVITSKIPSLIDQEFSNQAKNLEERIGLLVNETLQKETEEFIKNYEGNLSKLLEPKLKSFESGWAIAAGQILNKSLADRQDESEQWKRLTRGEFDAKLENNSVDLEEKLVHCKNEIEFLTKQLSQSIQDGNIQRNEMSNEINKLLEHRLGQFEKRLEDLKASYQSSLSEIKQAIQALPVPQVYFPPESIKIEQLPSQVNVSVPESDYQGMLGMVRDTLQSLLDSQERLDIQLLLDGLKMAIASLPPPVLPPPRLVMKTISYDEYSRPSGTLEKELEK